ncbi:LysE family translocator [Marinicellulosiphila megalodicopiae]|uniref:LysE family translocator n=1 Tax=Marinicellulosiphila megalodicopiae TaxID=2724896 RepID=UPI003BB18E38
MNIALIFFAFVSTATPGPNNIMMLSSGVNFGVKRSVPHWLGIITGVPLMMAILGLLIGLGLETLFEQKPWIFTMIKWTGCSYLLFLAFKIATLKEIKQTELNNQKSSKPFTYLQGMLFQWVNPKAWIMCLGAISTFSNPNLNIISEVLTISLTFFCVGFFGVGIWLVVGKQLQRLLSNTQRRRIFNITMATLLAGSIIPMML